MLVFAAEFGRNLYILKRFISAFMTLIQDWGVLEKSIQIRGIVKLIDICDDCLCNAQLYFQKFTGNSPVFYEKNAAVL